MSRRVMAVALAALTTVATTVALPAFARDTGSGYVSGRARMRAGPDDGYPVVARLHNGDGVVIHSCLSDWTWCDVGFEGQRGWLPATKILGESVRGRVPVAQIHSDLNIPSRGYNLDQYWDTHYNGRFDQQRGHWQAYYHDHEQPSWQQESQ